MKMSFKSGVSALFLVCVPFAGFAQAGSSPAAGQLQQPVPSVGAQGHKLVLDVVVTDKAGKPVADLQEKDFNVFDDQQPQKLLSFRVLGGDTASTETQAAEAPLKIVLLIDEVNTSFNRMANERNEIKRFLLQNGGKLHHPVSMAFFTNTGIETQKIATSDGNSLLGLFDEHVTGLRGVTSASGIHGAVELFQLSLRQLNSLAGSERQRPGRKMVIWVSPGWPVTPGGEGVDLNAEQERGLFASLIAVSTALREARITLYSVDPFGVDDAGGQVNYYQDFLKPVTTFKRIQIANLALQVFVRHSGGLVLNSTNDIAGLINRCLADADAYYTLTIDSPAADRRDEYHAIEVKAAKPGLTVRALAGYYAQP